MEISQIILFLLALTDLILVGMAVIRIRQRHLHWFDATAWLLLTLILPYLGPFLAIIQRNDSHIQGVDQTSSKNKAR